MTNPLMPAASSNDRPQPILQQVPTVWSLPDQRPRPASADSTMVDAAAITTSKLGGLPSIAPDPAAAGHGLDEREQLFNERKCGPIQSVSLPECRITDLHGIMLDLDPRLLRPSKFIPIVFEEPAEFYGAVAKPWLDRHDVLRRAEVRVSGRGLHIILRPDSPILLNSEGDRQRWKGIITVIQGCLPTDPSAPSLTALTRPIGSVNSKSGTPVVRLAAGEPIAIADLEVFAQAMRTQPFTTVLQILSGSERVRPCPVCQVDGSELSAVGKIGRCYAKCGKVDFTTLLNTVYALAANAQERSEIHAKAK